ncbi:hypothetical protein M422DRAFT_108576, partial [Sphaerobolus stellatus SS14]
VTSDNASNNTTMMKELARLIEKHTGKEFEWQDRWIRCLAHVINLATQAIIKAFSSAKYYDPYNPDAHIPTERDE